MSWNPNIKLPNYHRFTCWLCHGVEDNQKFPNWFVIYVHIIHRAINFSCLPLPNVNLSYFLKRLIIQIFSCCVEWSNTIVSQQIIITNQPSRIHKIGRIIFYCCPFICIQDIYHRINPNGYIIYPKTWRPSTEAFENFFLLESLEKFHAS